MRYTTENQPGTAQSPRFAAAGFDCQPPPGVIEELLGRKQRQRVKPPQESPPRVPRWQPLLTFIGTLCWPILSVAAFGGLMIVIETIGRHGAMVPARSVVTTPAPSVAVTPMPQPHVSSPTRTPPVVTVRRAEPVPITVRRAELLSVPIGTTAPIILEGQVIVVTYRGSVPTFDQLPRDPALGDMWHVSESLHDWVFCLPVGFTAPSWLDP